MEEYSQFYDPRFFTCVTNKHKEETNMTDKGPNKFWMITGEMNQPRVRHYHRQNAVDEATRLALAYPGKEFYIMETVELVTQPAGVVRHRF